MARPDAEGLFGTGADRHSVVVTVEVPSEEGDEERTLRLNPPRATGELGAGEGRGSRLTGAESRPSCSRVALTSADDSVDL